MRRRTPVVLDTDIGGDIDDTWALAMLVNSPELDLKMVLSEHGDTVYRARVAARFLQTVGRVDVPVGIGIATPHLLLNDWNPQEALVQDYDLGSYPGKVLTDGVGALVNLVMGSSEPITIIAIGPLTNIAAALERQPEIVSKARFVGMDGNIRELFSREVRVVPEYNVKVDIPASQKVFSAPWDMTITPLDTCGKVVLSGDRYAKVYRSESPIARAVMENYKAWVHYLSRKMDMDPLKYERESSILFDTVAVYLAMDDRFLNMEMLGVRVLADGLTSVDEAARKIRCAMTWKDREAFEDFLVRRITE
jgi:inosine-uridine nucleoside N-ribohydrolase